MASASAGSTSCPRPSPKRKTSRPKKPADPKDKAALKEKAEAVFKDAETKPKEEEIPPLPAEGDATVKASVDQLLNQPVAVTVEQAPRREVLDLITGQARLRYEIDDRTLAKDQINLTQPTTMKAPSIAARDALAELLGNIGLSYRVTDEGKPLITTAARLAEETSKKGAVIEGPPVKLVMSQPPMKRPTRLTASSPATPSPGAWPAKVCATDVVQFILAQYGQQLFEPGELIMLAHLSREAIDEAVLLDVFPAPKKLVRTALLVVHGVDPRLQDRARTFVQQLGDPPTKCAKRPRPSCKNSDPSPCPPWKMP